MSVATFTLKSASTQAAAPFSLGHAFKQGDVPSGSQLVAGFSDIQVVAKNAWPDGSLKFAVVSGRATLTADTPLSVALSIGTPSGGTALTTTDLKATGVSAAIDAGAFGSVSWATTDWDSPWQSWVSGPKMSSWVYRKPVGADAHLVAFVEVRLFSGGEVEVLPWIENGYFQVASPTNKSATYSFTLGGTSRYSGALDLKHHTRTPLINGTALSYWLDTAPGVTPRLDVAYLQSTELVPTYSASRSATGVATLPTTYAPFQIGGFTYYADNMAESGYQPPIGLLPEHDVAYLVCTDNFELLYGAAVRNGYSAGRYPLHYREASTNRAPRFSVHPTLVLAENSGVFHTGASTASNYTPTPAGGVNASWDTAHSPSVGFMAYLLTGHWYHVETIQFAATVNWFNITDWLPEASYRIRFYSSYGATQTRAVAWGFRALVQALTIMPDDDTALRDEFITLIDRIIDYFSMIYIEQSNNPYGLIQPGEFYDTVEGGMMIAIWQQDFFTATIGYAIAMGVPIPSDKFAKLETFFQWNAKHVVGRLGTSSDFWYVNGAPYDFPAGTTVLPDFAGGTGPWISDWADIYRRTWLDDPGYMSDTEGVLGAEFTSNTWARSMWGNIHPSISYAVRFGVPGAEAAYNRMTAASNYDDIQATFNISPVWSVAPASIGESTPERTMRKTIRCDTVSLIPGTVVCGDRGHGVLAAGIASGFPIASLLEDEVDVSDPVGTEYMVRILTVPVGLTIEVDEDGSYVATGADGTYVGDKRTYKNGVAEPDTTYTINIGFTSVSSNLAATYAMAGSVSGNLAATYTVASSVSSNLAAAYAILDSVSGNMAATYLIDSVTGQVSSDLSATYAILERINSDFAATFAIVAAVSANLAGAYAIEAETNYVRSPSGGGYRTKRTNPTTGRNTAQDGNR
jgi:hypothetical protein